MRMEKFAGSRSSSTGKSTAGRHWLPAAICSEGGRNLFWQAPRTQGTDYRSYWLAPKEWAEYGALGILAAALVAWLFYRNLWAFLILSPLAVVVPLGMREPLRKARQEELARQFRDGALALSSFLSCGYSVENAFRHGTHEMETIHGEDGLITGEFRRICREMELNMTVEEGVCDLAERSGLAEIRQFAEVFVSAKRSSGDLNTVLKDTAELLAKKIDLRQEIGTMVAAKKLEQNIMCLMPAGILVYINVTNPGYTDPLYGNAGGRVIMTICLAVYLLAIVWGQKILQIRV